MPRVVALLRGINVGGHRVAMADLRRHFEALKLRNVSTFIASGNVIFDPPAAADPAALESRIEQHLGKALGYGVPTILRTSGELQAVAARAFFEDLPATHVHVVLFLRAAPGRESERAFLSLRSEVDDLRVDGRDLHWLHRGGTIHDSEVWPRIEKLLKPVVATSRNMTTVRKLAALLGDTP